MKYVLMKNHFYFGSASRTSYGVALMEDADEMPGVIDAVVDLSDDAEKVMAFVDQCNRKKVGVTNLYDEVDTFLQ